MRRFLVYLLFLILGLCIYYLLLEKIYTASYKEFGIKNKIQWIRSMNSQDTLDYAVFGSSRVLYHIDPIIIQKRSGKIGLNLGYIGAGPFETYLAVKEYLRKNKVRDVFIQVDRQYSKQNRDEIGQLSWIPYLKEDEIFKDFQIFGNEYLYYHYIPFYRYQKFESRLGLRSVISNITRPNLNFNEKKGYNPVSVGFKGNKEFSIKMNNEKRSIYYDKIDELCKANNIKVYYFTAPYYNSDINFESLMSYFKEYKDFSNLILNKEYFADNIHLNKNGATQFTKHFCDIYFQKLE
jgi:hypothetical protein